MGDIWDIALYGSFIRGKEDARDMDIAVLTRKEFSEEKKLSLAQQIKEQLTNTFPEILFDVMVVDVSDFLNPHFLAREGIIAEGYLILKKEYLSKLLGFETFAYIKYSLQGLTASQKKMLYYALHGRRDMNGVLKEINGQCVSREVLKIPLQSSYNMEQLLKLHRVSYNMEFVMSYNKR